MTQNQIQLLGVTDHFALFGDPRDLTVVVDTGTNAACDPRPLHMMNLPTWGEPDPAQVPTEAFDAAENALGSAQRINGTDILVATAAAADKRSFAIPKAVQEEAQRALRLQAGRRTDDPNAPTPVSLNTARTLAKGGSIGISKVRHLAKFFERNPSTETLAEEAQIARGLWGGDSAARWATSIVRRSDALSARLVAAATGDPAPADLPLLPPAPADAPAAPAAPADAPAEPETPEDLAEDDPADADGIVWNAEDPHPFMPSIDLEDMCEVCNSDEYAIAHTDDSAETGLAAAGARIRDPRVFTDAMFASVVCDIPRPAFFITVDGKHVIDLFSRTEKGWRTWSAHEQGWVSAAEQPTSDVIPVDDESALAYADQLVLGVNAEIGIDPVEAQMFDEVDDADLPEVTPQPLEEVAFATSLDPETEEVDGLYIVTDDATCWAWTANTMADWQELEECPQDTTLVDLSVAREIAANMAPSFTPDEVEEAFERAAYIAAVSQTGGTEEPIIAAPRAPSARRYGVTADNQYTPPRKRPGARSNAQAYTPDERAQNASQQFRDAAGRFAKTGAIVSTDRGETAEVTGVNPTNNTVRVRLQDGTVSDRDPKTLTKIGQATSAPADDATKPKIDFSKIRAEPRAVRGATPKAFLPDLLPPLGAPEVKKVVSDYQKFIENERKRKIKEFAALNPDTSDVKPLHLAIVDELDNSAVIDLISLVPASDTSNEVTAFIRQDGTWVQDDDLMRKIQSTSPPPLVTLDDATYQTVLDQVDSFFKDQQKDKAQAASGMTLWSDDGVLLPANLTIQDLDVITAAGGDNRIEATARLHRYWGSPGQPGYAKIRWNTPGDWTRCVRHLSKYLGERAKGYCQKMHHETTGVYTGDRRNVGRRRGLRGDGSAMLLTVPSRITSTPESTPDATSMLVEVNIPSVKELASLRTRDFGHTLSSGERFLVRADDGIYTLSVLGEDTDYGWEGMVASVVAPYGAPTTLMILDQGEAEAHD